MNVMIESFNRTIIRKLIYDPKSMPLQNIPK